MPQYLQNLMGYTAESAGMVLSAAAVLLLIELPMVGQLTADSGALPDGVRLGNADHCDVFLDTADGPGDEFCFGDVAAHCPVSADGLHFHSGDHGGVSRIPQEKSNAVAGLINFVRNIGAAWERLR